MSWNTDLARRVWQRLLPSGPDYCLHRGRFATFVVGGNGGDRRPQSLQAWSGYWGEPCGMLDMDFGERSFHARVNRHALDTPRAEDKCVIQHTVLYDTDLPDYP